MTQHEALAELHRLHGESADDNPYRLGLYNGVESALACIEGREPEFKLPPRVWGDSVKKAVEEATSREE